jgi:hypothetical protein
MTQQKYFKEDDKTYYLSASEYSEVVKMRGRESSRLIRELLSDKTMMRLQDKVTNKYRILKYSQMSDDEKVRAIKRCYEDSAEYAKAKYMLKIYEEEAKSKDATQAQKKKLEDAKKVIKEHESE